MTIQEAIKSGKPFKRLNDNRWYMTISNGAIILEYNLRNNLPKDWISFSSTDLLADDWIIEEEKLELTSDQVLDAISATCAIRTRTPGAPIYYFSRLFLEDLLKNLGFKDVR